MQTSKGGAREEEEKKSVTHAGAQKIMNETSGGGGQCFRSESCESSPGYLTDCCDESLMIVRGHFSSARNSSTLCRCRPVSKPTVVESMLVLHIALACLFIGFLVLFCRRPNKNKSATDISIASLVREEAPEGEVCCVCLDAFRDNGPTSVRPANCRHYAHKKCMIKWIKEESQSLHLVCPMCLQPFVVVAAAAPPAEPPSSPALPPHTSVVPVAEEEEEEVGLP